MTVGLRMGSVVTEIGDGSFLHSFFSTISHHLEPKGWGKVYPVLMNKLYNGILQQSDARVALEELADIHKKLKKLKPSEVIWDIDNLTARPPWGDKISQTITDLANYFVTSRGKDLFGVLIENIQYLEKNGGVLEIVQYQGYPIGEQIKWENIPNKRAR